LHRIEEDFLRKEVEAAGPEAVAMLHGANFDKMLEVDPDPALRHSKEAAA